MSAIVRIFLHTFVNCELYQKWLSECTKTIFADIRSSFHRRPFRSIIKALIYIFGIVTSFFSRFFFFSFPYFSTCLVLFPFLLLSFSLFLLFSNLSFSIFSLLHQTIYLPFLPTTIYFPYSNIVYLAFCFPWLILVSLMFLFNFTSFLIFASFLLVLLFSLFLFNNLCFSISDLLKT